jgi:hypothetical protein
MLTATCHCGAVRIEVPRKPRSLTNCNCSICRRYGTLWAYYKVAEVRVTGGPEATNEYTWGDKTLRFVRCGTCGCITHWEPLRMMDDSKMGVNARNFEPGALGPIRIRMLDGASTWKYLD